MIGKAMNKKCNETVSILLVFEKYIIYVDWDLKL